MRGIRAAQIALALRRQTLSKEAEVHQVGASAQYVRCLAALQPYNRPGPGWH